MSGIVGSRLNIRGSGLVGSLGTDGQVFTSAGAGKSAVFEAAAGGGKVLQVQSTTMGDSIQLSPGSSWINITGLAVTITPSSSSNKILFDVQIQGGGLTSVWNFFSTLRSISGGASTTVGVGTHVSGETTRTRASAAAKEITAYDVQSSSFKHLDSPATTSAVTYQVRVIGNGTFECNRSTTFADNASTGNFASTITAMEIGV